MFVLHLNGDIGVEPVGFGPFFREGTHSTSEHTLSYEGQNDCRWCQLSPTRGLLSDPENVVSIPTASVCACFSEKVSHVSTGFARGNFFQYV